MKKADVKKAAAEVKELNVPFVFNSDAVFGLIERIAGKSYRDAFELKQIGASAVGMDEYRISDTESGKILIEATGGIAAASAFKWYLENKCNSYVGPITRRLNFPKAPPKVGKAVENKSICLYRYFLNYCTYGYTLAFYNWEDWEKLIDWMMLSGYNLVLNPVGNELVWITLLEKLGYTREEARNYISSPAHFPWQCMMNITGLHNAAPESWYKGRLALSKQINARLQSFGAAVMLPGWSGMVPNDFKEHFPESNPLEQGLWNDMLRPSLLMPNDKNFNTVGSCYYETQKELLGDNFKYFSTDPFHEGGNTENVDMVDYAQKCYKLMSQAAPNAVWFLQGWQNNPRREMIKALSPREILIGNLCATINCDAGDNFADYPWTYCCVNNFGGIRSLRGSMRKMLEEAIWAADNANYTCVGIGMIPEGIEICEILFDIFSDYAIKDTVFNSDEWLKEKIKARYGICTENMFAAWKIISNDILVSDGDETTPRESALCARPSLTVDKVSAWSCNHFIYDIKVLQKAFKLLMSDYSKVEMSETYRLDIIDIARQTVADSAWSAVEGLQKAFKDGNLQDFEANASLLMKHYDMQEALTCCDKNTMLGYWLKKAERHAETNSEKAYYRFLAITLITLWGDKGGSKDLFDYAAREYSGMLEDYYKKRWQSFINTLRISFVTQKPPMEFSRYDTELYFALSEKEYPSESYGDLTSALQAVLEFFE